MHLKYILIVFNININFPLITGIYSRSLWNKSFLRLSWKLCNFFFLPSLSHRSFLSFCLNIFLSSTYSAVASLYLDFPCWPFRQNTLPSPLFILSNVMLNLMNDLLLSTLKVAAFQWSFAWYIYILWRTGKLKSVLQLSQENYSVLACYN